MSVLIEVQDDRTVVEGLRTENELTAHCTHKLKIPHDLTTEQKIKFVQGEVYAALGSIEQQLRRQVTAKKELVVNPTPESIAFLSPKLPNTPPPQP